VSALISSKNLHHLPLKLRTGHFEAHVKLEQRISLLGRENDSDPESRDFYLDAKDSFGIFSPFLQEPLCVTDTG
jgi:hypothetical protein